MGFIDLTIPLHDQDPRVAFDYLHTIASWGANVTRVTAAVHAGTHMDAPCHMIPGAASITATPIERCIGVAEVIDLPDHADGAWIDAEHLAPFAERIVPGSRLLLRTGWSERYGWPRFSDGYPALTVAAASWLAERGCVLVGIDSVSIAPVYAGMELTRAVHLPLFEREVVIVEGLCNLSRLSQPRVYLIALPLPLVGRDGSPVRVVAFDGEHPAPPPSASHPA